jgi:ABC-type phosphate transport system substrate-binding protein
VNRKRFLAVVGGLLVAILAFSTNPAQADPNGPPTFRDLAGVGSDTTEGVMNGLSDVVVDGTGTKLIASYDAFGSPTITTKDPAVKPACSNINRPAGSGNGVTALVNSLAAADGCIDFARSSANNSASFAGKNLTYIPFGVDAVAYAVRSDSALSRKLTKAQLTTVYNCGAGPNYLPMLPQFGSGTRKFFLSSLGFTDAADFTSQPNHTCISQVDSTGAPLQENNGLLLTDPKQLAPYSIAQYLSQTTTVVPDIHGKTVLGQIDGIAPTVLNNSSTMVRDVYNVIPNSKLTDPEYLNVFIGSTSQICTNQNTIKKYGFALHATCGDTSIHTP